MQQVIYLALHGETEWNQVRRFQGRLDSPVTSIGIDQSMRMGETLRQLINGQIGWIVMSSPLQRARTTAQIICNSLSIDPEFIEVDTRLAEIDIGSWSGLTREEIDTRWPCILDAYSRYDWYFRSPDGESLDDLSERMENWLEDMTEHHQLIVVCHGIASRILRGLYARLPKTTALALEVSRNTIWRLALGQIDRIPCK